MHVKHMEERLRKERTEEIVEVAQRQLADGSVQEQLGDRGAVLRFVADMMRVPDIDGSYLVEFPGYETDNVFPVVLLNKDDRFISTMTARMPIQQAAIREQAARQWGEQGIDYDEEAIGTLLNMPQGGSLRLDYSQRRKGFHIPYRNVVTHKHDDQAPYMVQVGRPHIALQSLDKPKVKDQANTLVHELSHAVNAVIEPVFFLETDPESRALQLHRLRGELAAYATESVVRRAFRTKSDIFRDLFTPALCDVIEAHRRRYNGPYTAEGAFEPDWKIEKKLGAAGLKYIYWDNE
jgi:predicted metalloprotease